MKKSKIVIENKAFEVIVKELKNKNICEMVSVYWDISVSSYVDKRK